MRNIERRNRLISEHVGRVPKIVANVTRHLPSGVDRGNLLGAGMLGLVHAAADFDARRAVRFESYLEHRVSGYVRDAMRRDDWLPRSRRRQSKDIRRCRAELEQKLGRRATLDEVAEKTGLSRERIDSILLSKIVSWERPKERCSQIVSRFGASGVSGIDAFEATAARERDAMVKGLLLGLPRRERLILMLYYYDELTMTNIGKVVGVNESRISQLHSNAIEALRKGVRMERCSQIVKRFESL